MLKASQLQLPGAETTTGKEIADCVNMFEVYNCKDN